MIQLTNIRKNFKGTKKRQKIAPLQNLSLPRVREARRSYMCLAYGEEITRNKKKQNVKVNVEFRETFTRLYSNYDIMFAVWFIFMRLCSITIVIS